MSKALDTLIKLHKNKASALLQEVKNLEIEQKRLEHKKSMLQAQVTIEMNKYANGEYGFMFYSYLQQSNNMLNKLSALIQQASQQLHHKQQLLQQEYRELKKYQIANQTRVSAAIQQVNRDEAKTIEEQNLQRFTANSKDNSSN